MERRDGGTSQAFPSTKPIEDRRKIRHIATAISEADGRLSSVSLDHLPNETSYSSRNLEP
jgi:hypothetical protein